MSWSSLFSFSSISVFCCLLSFETLLGISPREVEISRRLLPYLIQMFLFLKWNSWSGQMNILCVSLLEVHFGINILHSKSWAATMSLSLLLCAWIEPSVGHTVDDRYTGIEEVSGMWNGVELTLVWANKEQYHNWYGVLERGREVDWVLSLWFRRGSDVK